LKQFVISTYCTHMQRSYLFKPCGIQISRENNTCSRITEYRSIGRRHYRPAFETFQSLRINVGHWMFLLYRRIMQRGILRFRICNHLWSVNGTLRDVFSQSVFASSDIVFSSLCCWTLLILRRKVSWIYPAPSHTRALYRAITALHHSLLLFPRSYAVSP